MKVSIVECEVVRRVVPWGAVGCFGNLGLRNGLLPLEPQTKMSADPSLLFCQVQGEQQWQNRCGRVRCDGRDEKTT